jgi:hypothetical protein
MLYWQTWATDTSTRRGKLTHIQTNKEMVERIVVPFAADDEDRDVLFESLIEVIDNITTTENKIELVVGEDFLQLRRLY